MIDLEDVQGLVFYGHGHMPFSRFIFLQITDAPTVRTWLGSVLPEVSSSRAKSSTHQKPTATAHVAFTAEGLIAIGLNPDTVQAFPREYTEGMSSGERPRVLGDVNANAPETWELGGPTNAPVHILLALYAHSADALQQYESQPWYPTSNCGASIVFVQNSHKESANEPFGFKDGISQPAVIGGPMPIPTDPNAMPALTPGEFVLGYNNEYANLAPAPAVPASTDKNGVLPADPEGGNGRSFGKNGTFLVFRKLKQDVDGFWKWCEDTTRKSDGSIDADAKEMLAAKLVGRYKSGCPLTLSPNADNPALGAADKSNSFRFAATDLAGYSCPIGSHIRRANPRDVLHPNKPERSVVISKRHRIMRRGRPYKDAKPDGTSEVGLLFIAINADLQRQFEFVQQTWLNNPTFNGLFDDEDPLVSNADGPGNMTIQAQPVRKKLHGIPQFVTMRGGAYFFLPGLRALKYLASLA
jgi:Dyp-type peroxidase family